MNKTYSLRYLPLFVNDLQKVKGYISNKLHNPDAAELLVEEVENAILHRMSSPESFEQYQSNRKREYPYYRIYVKNYVVFYVVIDDIMEARRFLYAGRDTDDIL